MSYSQVGIINLALGRIGVARIASLTENSRQALAASAVWEYIYNEVNMAEDWYFARFRVSLTASLLTVTSPMGYDHAYELPSDFLRLVRGTTDDPAISPAGYPYKIELVTTAGGVKRAIVTDAATCLINHIRAITTYTKLSPAFIDALAFRLAAELSIHLVEGLTKYSDMIKFFLAALKHAKGVNRSMDYFDTVEDWIEPTKWIDSVRTQ